MIGGTEAWNVCSDGYLDISMASLDLYILIFLQHIDSDDVRSAVYIH